MYIRFQRMRFVFAFTLLVAAVLSSDLQSRLPAGWDSILGLARLSNSFSCDNRGLGYYADVENDCRIFHMCVPFNDAFGHHQFTSIYSFFCPNTTSFSQDSLTCTYDRDAYPCDQAESLYETSNNLVGVVPAISDSGDTRTSPVAGKPFFLSHPVFRKG